MSTRSARNDLRSTARATVALALLAAMLAPVLGVGRANGATSQQEKQTCVASSEKAQVLRSEAKMLAARTELLVCARDACPSIVRKDCARWLAELDDALPTIVLAAKDGDGHDVTDVKVAVDGAVLTESLDGKAVPIDPGPHDFVFTRTGEDPIAQRVLVKEGEKNRIVTVTFAKPAKPPAPVSPPPQSTTTVPTASWIFGAVGVVALGSFVGFGAAARSQADQLRSTCAPACGDGDVDSVRTKVIIADVSLGVAVVSFGLATFFLLSGSSESKKDEKTGSATALGFTPLTGGGALGLTGRF